MQLLLIILSVMTLTVKDKNSVTADGVVPPEMEATYSCTYQKGTVRKGDEAVLTLSRLGGITVEKIEMAMRGNKTAGAAAIVATADETLLAAKNVTYNTVGSSVVVFSGAKVDVEEMVITLTGTENSMYVDSYTITYAEPPVHTVTLMKGDHIYVSLTEQIGGEGIILPAVPDSAEWHFVGWSETEFWATNNKPELNYPNRTYFPSQDATLWAVFRFQKEEEVSYMTTPVSGDYMYVNRDLDIALTGVPADGKMDFSVVDETNEDLYYTVDFTAPDTAYITHTKTQTPIGFIASSHKMTSKASPWLVYHEGEETLFYTIIKGKTYILWLDILDSVNEGYYSGLFQTDNLTSPMALMPRRDREDPVYTCHPEAKVGFHSVYATPDTDYILPFGNYELHIHNGQKYLQLR